MRKENGYLATAFWMLLMVAVVATSLLITSCTTVSRISNNEVDQNDSFNLTVADCVKQNVFEHKYYDRDGKLLGEATIPVPGCFTLQRQASQIAAVGQTASNIGVALIGLGGVYLATKDNKDIARINRNTSVELAEIDSRENIATIQAIQQTAGGLQGIVDDIITKIPDPAEPIDFNELLNDDAAVEEPVTEGDMNRIDSLF